MVIVSRNPIHSIFFLILAFIGISAIMFTFNIEFLPIIFLVVYVGAVSVLFLFVVMMLNIKIIETYENFFNYLPVGIFIGFIFFIELYLFFLKDLNIYFYDMKDYYSLYKYITDCLIYTNNEEFLFNFLGYSEGSLKSFYPEDLNISDFVYTFESRFLTYQLFDYLDNFFNIEYVSYISEKEALTDIEIIAQVIYQHKFFAFIISSLILLIAMIGAIVLTLTIKRDNFSTKRQDISEQVYRKIQLKIHKNINNFYFSK